jgi:hypothetical protein
LVSVDQTGQSTSVDFVAPEVTPILRKLRAQVCRDYHIHCFLHTTLAQIGDASNVSALVCELKRKKPARQKEEDFHHNVYVVLLKDAVTKHPSILRFNPKRDPLKPCVYVGMTGIPVNHRFENHKNGYKSAWVVRKYGLRLMPELYEHLNPMPFEAAVQMESELAEDLRAAGYTVTGGH